MVSRQRSHPAALAEGTGAREEDGLEGVRSAVRVTLSDHSIERFRERSSVPTHRLTDARVCQMIQRAVRRGTRLRRDNAHHRYRESVLSDGQHLVFVFSRAHGADGAGGLWTLTTVLTQEQDIAAHRMFDHRLTNGTGS